MSDEIIGSLISRINRLETVVGSFSTSHIKFELQDAIEAARKNDAATLAKLQDEVRELRAQLSVTAKKTDLTALNNRIVDGTQDLLSTVVADEAIRLEKHAETTAADAVRAVRRDVSVAVDAATANVKAASALLSRYAEELGS